ncbi:DNA polymerase III subunit delta' [Alloalcanivorax profundimaris]|uniref:DNA polymerase III subunit delta' n=1 Tax=Alloalcanivorax profundimaris TaxID=2735259 RepID=UPI00210D6470|nr:DNA polymerase III subunit delta' [Alloalcanivorax profundimaris]MCQ6262347.1 DNA polymerase III subunit delta' [Alcanivorax sp. MM125-6]UWN48165.1 DNA polymerase III subunit delta' [Alcanivorax sp. ALC70]
MAVSQSQSRAPIQVPCPWHRDEMQRLLDQHGQGRLPHALLFAGAAGIGKFRLAQALAQALLCEQPRGGLACGECGGCHLSAAGTHPDAQTLAPEAGANGIKIDQVRRLVEFAGRTAQYGGARVALIAPAEALNRSAQNALLKTLEEPGRGLVLLLVSDQPSLLLPTIRSRCQQRHLPLPGRDAALEWLTPQVGERDAPALLAAAQGAPLRALGLQEADWFAAREQLAGQLLAVARGHASPAQAGQALAAHDPRVMAGVLYGWLARASVLAALGEQGGEADPATVTDPKVEPLLRQLAAQVPPARLLRAAHRVMEGRRQLLGGANPNKELLMEQWLLVLVGVDASASGF